MNRILPAALLVVTTVFTLALAQTTNQPSGRGQTNTSNSNRAGNDEQAIRQLLNDVAAALTRNDATALDRFYAEDYTLVNPSGALVTKAQRLALVRSGEVRYESFSYDEVSNIRRYGNTAVVTARAMVTGQERGQAINTQSRVTFTLVRAGGQWQIVAAQATPIAPPQASPTPAAQPQASPSPAAQPQTTPRV